MKNLLKYMKGYVKESIIAPLFKMLEASFELIVPVVTARVVDVGIKNADKSYIWRQCIVLVILGIIGLLCAITAQYFAAKAAFGFGTNLRADLYKHINSLSYTELDTVGTPTLVTRITSDVNQMQTGVNLFLRLFLRSPFIVIGSVIMAMTISLKLSVIFLISVPMIGLVIFLIVKFTMPIYKKVQNMLDRVVLLTRENYEGARVVRAFRRQESEKEEFARTNDHLKKTQFKAGRISALMNPATYALANLAIIVILLAGGRQVDTGNLTQGEVIALVNYMNQALLALIVLANLVITVSRAWASAIRINEVFAVEPSMTAPEKRMEDSKKCCEPEDAVVFDHVTFTFAKAQAPSLSDIHFTAKKGQTIGVIGGTGSGKSTLVNLIPRFYDATKGRVLVDGVLVGEYPFEQLRGKTGIVPQRSVLFRGTIRENMQWGKADATDDEIWKALTIAQAADFVREKGNGLDEPVATRGGNFSGGQRQRLCIARALVKDPKVLILDDSSSALDFATDAALRSAIKKGTEGMTTFIVSQRAATVKGSDLILVLDDGKMAGIGTHEELLKDCEVYREICESQFSKEEVTGL
ncbi:ABC transporter ATP-binding protein [Blautia liquoris]|uniref:ABC transporter ATP-binding protein n=1 Tax=Blautia liquoris TaxID=2779518 RepID=A0A7M2RGZ0_9FIRM|nr:ABC transporter ATP-binding protein [Blautia liquoris]QOV19585.1 ABC transporter ATP-binding protein [Blautia liquoris]